MEVLCYAWIGVVLNQDLQDWDDAMHCLWIDESPMNLVEILGFQPKGVATL